MGRLPIKDCRHRSFLTIYGPVKVRSAGLKDCQRCSPWSHLTHSPLAYLCPDRATPELNANATMALEDQGYDGQSEIIVLSDGEDCLKKLVNGLPNSAKHVLDWFHISMKIQPLRQLAKTAPKEIEVFAHDTNRIKWRLWHGQADRAITLAAHLNAQVTRLTDQSLWAFRASKLLRKLRSYIQQNRSSIVNYSARYRSGERIATSLAKSSVNTLVAKRFVKKQQMRWSRPGAHYLLKVRTAVINSDLPKTRPKSDGMHHDARMASKGPSSGQTQFKLELDPTVLNGLYEVICG